MNQPQKTNAIARSPTLPEGLDNEAISMSLRAQRSNPHEANEIASPSARNDTGKHRNHTRAETLIETVISVFILSLLLWPTASMLVDAVRATATDRNDLIAAALADEGIEMMVNFRDTNLLKFSPKAEQCWDAKPDPAINLEHCDIPQNHLASGNFRLSMDLGTFEWKLEEEAQPLSDNLSAQTDAPYRLKLDPAEHLYNHASGDETSFYRSVSISRLPNSEDKILKIVSKVVYRQSGSPRKLKRVAFLTPYAE